MLNSIVLYSKQSRKPFNCVQTIAIHSYSFENKITYKLLTYKSYMYNRLTECKQMTDDKLLMLHSNTWNPSTVCKND